MTVKDGKVTESNYDNVNADGKSKKMTPEYESKMKRRYWRWTKRIYRNIKQKNLLKAMGEEDWLTCRC